MKRLLAIVLVGALLCAFGAWLFTLRGVSRRGLDSSLAPELAEPVPAPDAEALEAKAPDAPARAVRTDLTTLEPLVLNFKGPRATLNLRVVDKLKRNPLGDVAVRPFDAHSRRSPDSGEPRIDWSDLTGWKDPPQTDGSGRLSLSVPASRRLRLDLEGKGLRTNQRIEEIEALTPDEVRLVEIELAVEDDVRFCGRSCDKLTNVPLAGVEIHLQRRPSIEPIARSNAHGLVEFRTNSWESRKATASKRGYVPLEFEVGDLHDEPARAMQLALTPAATVNGYYRDCDDKPAKNGSLRFWTESGFTAHVYPREDGWFSADSLPTNESVLVDLDLEHRPMVRGVASVVLAPAEVRRIDWKLPQLTALKGIVLDETGAPVKEGELALYFGNADDLRCLPLKSGLDVRDSCITDSEGRFEFPMAGDGMWVVALLNVRRSRSFLLDRNSWRTPLAALNITISGPKAEEVVLRCWRQLTIQGRVVDPDGQPVPTAVLYVSPPGCEQNRVQSWVGKDGSFSVLVPGPDTFELRVETDGQFLESAKVAARGGEHDVVLRLKRAPVLRVRVVDEQTREPLRAQVFGIGASGASVEIGDLEAADDPALLTTACPPDTYRLMARSIDGRCGALDGVSIDADSSAHEWIIPVAQGRVALLHSSNAAGPVEVYLTWSGIPIDQQEIPKDSRMLVSVPPGLLSARYRCEEPLGEWRTLETPIDDPNPVDIDLRFP